MWLFRRELVLLCDSPIGLDSIVSPTVELPNMAWAGLSLLARKSMTIVAVSM
jgi:hypothetical protein